MCYMIVLCHLFFFFFSLLSFFSFFVFFLMLFVNVHKISILLSLCPNIFCFSFFTKFFLWLLFHLSDLYITAFFFLFNSINLWFTWALSRQFSSYFVINNVILFDFVWTFQIFTVVPNFTAYHIYICINLTIVLIFTENIFTFVFYIIS